MARQINKPVVNVTQSFSATEQAQARENISAESQADAKAKVNAYGILMRENGTNTLQFYRPSLA